MNFPLNIPAVVMPIIIPEFETMRLIKKLPRSPARLGITPEAIAVGVLFST